LLIGLLEDMNPDVIICGISYGNAIASVSPKKKKERRKDATNNNI